MSNENPAVISKQRLAEFLFNQGIPDGSIMIPGQRYALPSRKWLFSAPAAAKIAAAIRRDIPAGYRVGPSVCYHFSSIAVNELKRLHRISKFSPEGADFAVADFHFMPDRMMSLPADKREGHAVVAAIWSPDNGITLDLAWMEPQTRLEAFLTSDEVDRCSKIDFE